MFRFFAPFVLLLSVTLAGPALAASPYSCDDLSNMSDDLDATATALADTGEIREGSPADEALGEMVDALLVIAGHEKDAALTTSVKAMDAAWQENEWDGFKRALDKVINAIDTLNDRDCQ